MADTASCAIFSSEYHSIFFLQPIPAGHRFRLCPASIPSLWFPLPRGSRSELYLPPDRTGCSPISDQGVLVCLAWFDGGYSSHPALRPHFLSFATFNISSSATGGPRCAQPHQPSVASTLFFIKMSLRILDADVDASMACMACIRSAWTKASDNATSPPRH